MLWSDFAYSKCWQVSVKYALENALTISYLKSPEIQREWHQDSNRKCLHVVAFDRSSVVYKIYNRKSDLRKCTAIRTGW